MILELNAFQGRLLPGERVIWSGLPGQGIVLTSQDIFLIPFSIAWCSFAIFWEWQVAGSGAPTFALLWGGMFVAVGLFFVFGRFLLDAWVRSKTRYALTDQRVLIERSGPLAKFVAIRLDQIADTMLSERGGGRGSIRFGSSAPRWGNRGMTSWSPSLDPTPQFILIEDVRRVFNLVQQNGPSR